MFSEHLFFPQQKIVGGGGGGGGGGGDYGPKKMTKIIPTRVLVISFDTFVVPKFSSKHAEV